MKEGEPKEGSQFEVTFSEHQKRIADCKHWIEVFAKEIDGLIKKIEDTQREMEQLSESGKELIINTEKGEERFVEYEKRFIEYLKELLADQKKQKELQEKLLEALELQEKSLTQLALMVKDQQGN